MVLYGQVDLELAEQIRASEGVGADAVQEDAADAEPRRAAESDDITGGIGFEGLANLKRFVEDGGLLVTLGNGSQLALEAVSCAA